jgi:hypothetical protein
MADHLHTTRPHPLLQLAEHPAAVARAVLLPIRVLWVLVIVLEDMQQSGAGGRGVAAKLPSTCTQSKRRDFNDLLRGLPDDAGAALQGGAA